MSFARGTKYDVRSSLVTSKNVDKLPRTSNMPSKSVTNREPANKRTSGFRERPVTALQQTSTMELPQQAPKFSKLKAIPIRHTLTSKLRMEKANPLLTLSSMPDMNKSSHLQIVETPVRRLTFHPGMLPVKQKLDFQTIGPVSESRVSRKKSIANNEKKNIGNCLFKENKVPSISTRLKDKMSNVQSGSVISKQHQPCVVNKYVTSLCQERSTLSCKQSKNMSLENKNIQASTHLRSGRSSIFSESNLKGTSNTTSKTRPHNTKMRDVEIKKTVVKSTLVGPGPYVQNSQSGKCVNAPAPVKQLKSILRKSVSASDLCNVYATAKEPVVLRGIENRPSLVANFQNKSQKCVAFHSPLLNTTFSPVNITNTPAPSVLRKRLKDWLTGRGKSSYSYKHLSCFGLPKNATIISTKVKECEGESCINEKVTCKEDEKGEPRLNETITLGSSDSGVILSHSLETDFENNSPNGSSTPQQDTTLADDKENCTYLAHPEALNDLRKLVRSGYPIDECEHWVDLISKSSLTVKEFPEYWECLAALEEARGEFDSAVTYYERAVVKGADAEGIDKCLDALWERLSAAQRKRTPSRKLAVDTKQLFKSTVIKFALQQKAVTKFTMETGMSFQSVNYIVTPLRRNSRRSLPRFKATPAVPCVDILDNLEV